MDFSCWFFISPPIHITSISNPQWAGYVCVSYGLDFSWYCCYPYPRTPHPSTDHKVLRNSNTSVWGVLQITLITLSGISAVLPRLWNTYSVICCLVTHYYLWLTYSVTGLLTVSYVFSHSPLPVSYMLNCSVTSYWLSHTIWVTDHWLCHTCSVTGYWMCQTCSFPHYWLCHTLHVQSPTTDCVFMFSHSLLTVSTC